MAGVYGGRVVFEGSYQELLKSKSVTALELNKKTSLKSKVRKSESFFEIYNANSHNLKNINVKIPKKLLCCITGVAGSGKSSLIHKDFIAKYPNAIVIDQKPIGQSNRSNLATYSGLFDDIRKIYSEENNVSASFFSFNSKGACNKCNGSGFVEVEMAFLEPIKTVCDKCKGKKYQESVLQYKYKNKNIAELLSLSIDQTINLFEDKTILQKITMLQKVGLGYLSIGQALSTLSGGECQRIKLSSELYKKGNIYILDEPTTGLHMQDIQKIIDILNELVDNGNSVIVIEHNLEVITQADWIIDIGPESGEYGGQVVFEGTSQELIHFPKSYTGQYLKNYIQ